MIYTPIKNAPHLIFLAIYKLFFRRFQSDTPLLHNERDTRLRSQFLQQAGKGVD